MTNTKFEFPEFHLRAKTIRAQLIEVLSNSGDEKVRKLVSDMPSLESQQDGADRPRPPLTVAFVGQYDSGKSTMISALTGRKDIPIDADVCTDKVTAYDWNGIRILDTPGIHAGYPEHDEKTKTAVDRSDLLVFVITNELFDDVIGKHFRELCLERNKAAEILLVVNKISQDPGKPEVKLPDIERVTKPLTPIDFRTTFIDALSFLEATDEESKEDHQELLELSNFHAFITALNAFVREKGLMGRLTTPLFDMRALAQQAEAFLTVDMPEEKAAIELLNRKRGLLNGSRSRLKSAMSGLISAAASDLVAYGDAVAAAIEPGATEQAVQAKQKDAQRQAGARCERLVSDAQTAVESELGELRRQLEALDNGALARELKGQVSAALKVAEGASDQSEASPGFKWEGRTGTVPSDWPTRMKKVGEAADGLGKYAAQWTTGPMAEGAKIGSATAARGSQAHQAVYSVGKFFGVNFKPWGAVKVVQAIGNVGRVIGAVGGVLAVVGQIAEEKQQDAHRVELHDARYSIRTEYRVSVREIEETFWDRFEKFAMDFYDNELAAVSKTITDFVGQQSSRNKETQRFHELASEATKQIMAIQALT